MTKDVVPDQLLSSRKLMLACKFVSLNSLPLQHHAIYYSQATKHSFGERRLLAVHRDGLLLQIGQVKSIVVPGDLHNLRAEVPGPSHPERSTASEALRLTTVQGTQVGRKLAAPNHPPPLHS